MKKYFIITPMNDIEYVGEFEKFKDAWDFIEYECNKRFVWLVSGNSIAKLNNKFNSILENIKMNYKELSDKELKDLLEYGFVEEYEKLYILNILVERGVVEFVKEEYIH